MEFIPLILPRPKCGTQDQLFRKEIVQRGNLKLKESLLWCHCLWLHCLPGKSPSEPFKTRLSYQGQCLSAIKKSGQINVKGWGNAGSDTSLLERPWCRAWVSVWWKPVWSWDMVRVMALGQGLGSPGGSRETPKSKWGRVVGYVLPRAWNPTSELLPKYKVCL